MTRPIGAAARVLLLADGTRNTREIAAAAGLSVIQVYRAAAYLRRCGHRPVLLTSPYVRRARPYRHAHIKLITLALERGESLQSIGDRLGVSCQRVSQILQRAGLTPARTARAVEREAKRQQEMLDIEARWAQRLAVLDRGADMVRRGASILEVEAILGLGRGILNRHLHKIGVESKHGPWRAGMRQRTLD